MEKVAEEGMDDYFSPSAQSLTYKHPVILQANSEK